MILFYIRFSLSFTYIGTTSSLLNATVWHSRVKLTEASNTVVLYVLIFRWPFKS